MDFGIESKKDEQFIICPQCGNRKKRKGIAGVATCDKCSNRGGFDFRNN